MDLTLHKERLCVRCNILLKNKRKDAKYCNNCLRKIRNEASKESHAKKRKKEFPKDDKPKKFRAIFPNRLGKMLERISNS